MKLFLQIIITFFITSTLSVQAIEFDKKTRDKLKDMGFYEGNPKENIFIEQGDLYLIIHNPTELALTVMEQEAKNYCKTKLENDNYTSNFMKILGRYTAYFSCEIKNKTDEYNLSDLEKECIEDKIFENYKCETLNKENVDIINEIEQQIKIEGQYKTIDFINIIRTSNYDKIEEFEKAAEDKRIKIIIEMQKTNIEQNKEICKSYNFEEGSQMYGECILKLIEINQ